MNMKRILKTLLVMIATIGLSGYARVPEGEALARQQARVPSVATVARMEAPVAPGAAEPRERSGWTLLFCGFVVVGVIARRKSRLVAG
jgi:hypothetical protein